MMTKPRMFAPLMLAALLATFSLGLAAQPAQVAIGGVFPQSGDLSARAAAVEAGVALAVDEINAAGGVLGGAPLVYLPGDADNAAAEAERLIAEGASALLCCLDAQAAVDAASVAVGAGVPLIVQATGADPLFEAGLSGIFRLEPSDEALGAGAVDGLIEITSRSGAMVETVVLLYDDQEVATTALADAFIDRANQVGLDVLYAVGYNPDAGDLTTDLVNLSAGAPDVLVVVGDAEGGLLVARNAEEVGLDVRAIYGVGSTTYDSAEFVAAERASAECYLNANPWWDPNNPAALDARDRYAGQFGADMTADALLAYQAVYVVADAIARAGSADPASVSAALAATDTAGHLLAYPGAINFGRDGGAVNAAPAVTQVLDGGVVAVWPDDFAQSAPVYPCTSWGYPR